MFVGGVFRGAVVAESLYSSSGPEYSFCSLSFSCSPAVTWGSAARRTRPRCLTEQSGRLRLRPDHGGEFKVHACAHAERPAAPSSPYQQHHVRSLRLGDDHSRPRLVNNGQHCLWVSDQRLSLMRLAGRSRAWLGRSCQRLVSCQSLDAKNLRPPTTLYHRDTGPSWPSSPS
jgi:hypothetical protein